MTTPDETQAPEGDGQTALEPLRLAPIFLEKIWGGSRMGEITGVETGGRKGIGESWLASDLEGRQTRVVGGAREGARLGQLARAETDLILGRAALNGDERFPVLVKFLDTARPLSVQVHPDGRTAHRLGAGSSGKSEAWYVLAAEPDSLIHLGLRPEVDATAFAAGATGAEIVDLLNPFDVNAGDCFHVPPGTVHAIGAGITLLEISQSADLTYRFYDWDRLDGDGQPRQVHPEEALLSVDYEREVQAAFRPEFLAAGTASSRAQIVDDPAFVFDLLRIGDEIDLDTNELAVLYVVTRGRGEFVTRSGTREVGQGECWLVPAALGEHSLVAGNSELEVARVETRASGEED